MVKIRLRRMGNRHRPFYRVVVAKSTAARDGAFIEILGTYNPLTNPKQIEIDGEKALQWLMNGAQPSETVANLFKREGILDKFFEQRPNAKKNYGFLDKTTSAMTVQSMATAATASSTSEAESKPAETSSETKEEPKAEAASEEPTPEANEAKEAPAESSDSDTKKEE